MPAAAPQLRFTARPALGPLYFRVLTRRRRGVRPGELLPAITAEWTTAIDRAALARYREACGLPAGDTLPILYPHVMAGPLHLAMFSDAAFPLSLLGSVHSRNHAVQRAPVPATGTVTLSCRVGAQRVLKAGLEFDLETRLTSGGTVAWESLSTFLVRGKKFGAPGEPHALAKLPDLGAPDHETAWKVPADMGRRYAKITGDHNPIHTSNIGAKLFGFRSAIIHGMWSAARSVAALPPLPGEGGIRFDVLFKGPIFIGRQTTLKAACAPDRVRFDCFCAGNERPCLSGAIGRVAADAPVDPPAA